MTGADLHPDPSLLDIHITNLATINTDTGEITGIRSAGFGVIAGISFDVRGTAGVFRLHSLVVDEDVAIVGANAFALASLDDVHINKFVTARGDCTTTHGGPGGFAGGALGMPGSGPGGGAAGFAVGAFATGAGGGANGAHAGDGGVSSQTTSVMGGPAYGDPQISILRGGSGGGGGAGVGGVGGGGGGAVQIVSNTLISFNPPTMYQGMIDVSGCPGRAGSDGSGGGGGGGGTILLEARDVFMFSDALLLTTGAGGGGSGPGATDGGSDYLSRGGFNGSNGADGGDGGTHNFDALTLEGSPGTNGGSWGGGGGGGVGRIRVNSLHTPTLSGVYVPPFTDATTTATIGVPSVE